MGRAGRALSAEKCFLVAGFAPVRLPTLWAPQNAPAPRMLCSLQSSVLPQAVAASCFLPWCLFLHLLLLLHIVHFHQVIISDGSIPTVV